MWKLRQFKLNCNEKEVKTPIFEKYKEKYIENY